MQDLIPRAEKVARLLKERHETITVAESFDRRAAVRRIARLARCVGLFPRRRGALHAGGAARADGHDRAAERHARLDGGLCAARARLARERFGANWALAETGATGPTGNRYGDAPGHTCIAVVGKVERAMTLETGMIDRVENMRKFSEAALELLTQYAEREVAKGDWSIPIECLPILPRQPTFPPRP